MQKANHTVFFCNLLHNFHRQLVMIGRYISRGKYRRKLVLRGRDFVGGADRLRGPYRAARRASDGRPRLPAHHGAVRVAGRAALGLLRRDRARGVASRRCAGRHRDRVGRRSRVRSLGPTPQDCPGVR